MKNILRLVLLSSLVAQFLLAPAGGGTVQAQESQLADTIDLLVQVEGSRQPVVNQVNALGGSVRFSYKNVPAMVVALPAGKLQELANTSGVIKVEKDRMMSLGDTQPGKRNPFGGFPVRIEVSEKVSVNPLDGNAQPSSPLPQGFANTDYTGAQRVWQETAYGNGSVVAVVDSGTAPNLCLKNSLTGSPYFPKGYNATDDGIPANDPANYWHGTFVAGVIASYCTLDFSDDPDDPLYKAIYPYLPYSADSVPIYGQAPLAKIYPVKVFPVTGEATPTSVVLKGLDHILSLKKRGLLDIDVVNLSFGGPTVYDGRDTMDRFINELIKANVLVVAAAGNYGPMPNSLDSPATSFQGASVGALDYAPSSRIFYEYLGLTYGTDDNPYDGDEGPGMGMVMRPTGEVRVANFSSRGPTSDGRGGPAISALGTWNFQLGPKGKQFIWANGSSFSAPAVSGAAALLNAYWVAHNGQEPSALAVRDALLSGADAQAVGQTWREFNDQGFGALDIPKALEKLIEGASIPNYPVNTGKLTANVLGPPIQFKTEVYESGTVQVAPGASFDAVFQIGWATSQVTIEVFEITAPNNSARAHWGNALEVHVQSAKRSGHPHPAYFYWYPYKDKKSFTITIEDGPWTVAKQARDHQPLERGLMKLSLAGDYSNQNPVSFKLRITRVNEYKRTGQRLLNQELKWGDVVEIPVKIEPGVTRAEFDLVWNRDWRYYPTSDFDMLIYDPYGILVTKDGATSSAPERIVIADPIPGVWTVYIEAIEAYKPDNVRLFVRRE
ncbi:MAG TPA: S8 family serine peptidase [Anaerolineales bacterium]|nr:S8 family serine peptidase [Anaerolineales bacterium]